MKMVDQQKSGIHKQGLPPEYYFEIPLELVDESDLRKRISLTLGTKDDELVYLVRPKRRTGHLVGTEHRPQKDVLRLRIPQYLAESKNLEGTEFVWGRIGFDTELEINSVRDLIDIKGVGESKVERIIENGYDSLKELRETSIQELTEIEGLGPAVAKRIKYGADPIIIGIPE